MKVIIDNWELVLALVCAILCVATNIIVFVALPTEKKLTNLREWLLYAVVEAEKKFQGGTGAIKLRYVYNLAVDKFMWLPAVLTFEEFSAYVDDALEWMRVQLMSNKNIQNYVEGGENG